MWKGIIQNCPLNYLPTKQMCMDSHSRRAFKTQHFESELAAAVNIMLITSEHYTKNQYVLNLSLEKMKDTEIGYSMYQAV